MSDLSGLQPSCGAAAGTLVPSFDGLAPSTTELQPHEVGFRRLRNPQEIARIVHLRREIALPAAALGDAGFAAREKKETKSGSWGRWCVTVNTSERFATSR